VTLTKELCQITEIETGQTQWEPPTQADYEEIQTQGHPAEGDLLSPGSAQPAHAPKRRQYAAGQSQAYYGTPEPTYGDFGGGAGAGGYYAGAPGQPPAPGGPAAGGGFFTPGLVGEQQGFQQQQQQPAAAAAAAAAAAGYYGAQAPGPAPGYGGQQPPPGQAGAGGWYDSRPNFPPNPLQGPPGQETYGAAAPGAGYGQPGVDALAGQFSQMGMGGPAKPVSSVLPLVFDGS
jgi:protein transport protein SEC24